MPRRQDALPSRCRLLALAAITASCSTGRSEGSDVPVIVRAPQAPSVLWTRIVVDTFRGRQRRRLSTRPSATRPRACSSGAGTPSPRGGGVPRRRRLPGHDPSSARRHAGRPATRSASRGRGRARGSASTATTTSTASARPRWPSSSCASSAPTSTGTCRAASRRATACAGQTLTRLAGEGCGLVLTVDCGITAVDEIASAQRCGARRGRHRPSSPGRHAPRLPRRRDTPSAYPFPELCGTGVVYKLAEALLGPGDERLVRHLDLVALATIADVVPLVDENRALAIAGLRGSRRRQKPGLRALMRAARVDPAVLDEGAVGFRLAPRINAAGRLWPAERGARAAADRRRGRPPAGSRRARGAEPRAPGGRGPNPARGVAEGRRVARGAAPAARLRRSPTRAGTRE